MAYWLYCQNCKQWNKSAVPLSYDMSCSFCNNLFIQVKQQYINSISDDAEIEELKDSQNSPPISETTEIFEKYGEPNISDPGEALINPDTSENSEIPTAIETSEIPETFEQYEIPEETELSTTLDTSKVPEIPAAAEASEIPESELQEALDKLEEPTEPEVSETPEIEIPARRFFTGKKKRAKKLR